VPTFETFDEADDYSIRQVKLETLAALVPWLYSALVLRSNKISAVPWRLVDAAGNEVSDEELPIDMTDFLWRTELGLNLYGAAYWYIQLSKLDTVMSLRWFDPSSITIKRSQSKGLTAFERGLTNGAKEVYPVKDGKATNMLYVWLPGIREVEPGVPTARGAGKPAEVLLNLTIFQDKFFAQGAMPVTLLKIPAGARKEEIERLDHRFKRFATSVRNAFKPVAVRENVEVERLSFQPNELEMTSIAEARCDEVLAALQVPLSLLKGDAANYATAQQEAANFVANVIEPRVKLIERVLNNQLFADMGWQIVFETAGMAELQNDMAEMSQAFLNFVNGGMTPEGAAAVLGIELPEDVDPFTALTMPATPEPETQTEQPQEADIAEKDLQRWRRKAKKRFKASGSALVQFQSDAIDEATALALTAALAEAKTLGDVDAAFDASKILRWLDADYG